MAETVFDASCENCGSLKVAARDVFLRVEVGEQPPRGFYGFKCSLCQNDVRKPADARIVRMLVSGGVRGASTDVPSSWHTRPPITPANIREAMEWLDKTPNIVEEIDATNTGDAP